MEQVKIRILPLLLYIISFYASFRNANIYLFNGQNAVESVLLDYMYLTLLLGTFVWLIINRLYSKNDKINIKLLIMVVLIIWVVIQAIFNTILTGVNMIPRNLLSGLLAFTVLFLGIKNQRQFNYSFKSFVFGALVSALIPLIKFISVIGIRTTFYQGIYYPGGIWNAVLVSFISVGWLILAFLQRDEVKLGYKFWGLLSFLVIWIGAFAGVSRSFFLSTVISILIYAFASNNFKKLLQVTLVVGLVIIALETLLPETLSRIFERVMASVGNLAEESRVVIWKTYLENISNYAITGAFGNYQDYGPKGVKYGTHSVFLNWLVQYGFIGLIGFISLLVATISEIFAIRSIKPKEFSFILAWLGGYLMQILISETGFVEASIYVGLAFTMLWRKFSSIETSEMSIYKQ